MRLHLQPLHNGWAVLAAIAVLAAAVVLLIFWALADIGPKEVPFGGNGESPAVKAVRTVGDAEIKAGSAVTAAPVTDKGIEAALKQPIHLYFIADDGRHLVAETRTVLRPTDGAAFGRQIVLALLEGPRTPAGRSLPEDTGLRAFYLGEDGTAYVDLDETVTRQHPGGVTLERLSIYSLVNSLVLNADEIKTVRILIEGRETETLAGHIDLQRALKANMLMIK